jgi:ABC-2 type transport system ATP-binding protein
MAPPALSTEGLTKHYGAVVGIEGLDLTLEQGEILGFLGPNGAGKTTTIRLILGLLRPTAGSVAVFGEPTRWGQWRHRARLGFLPGDPRLPRRETGRAILRFLAALHGKIDWAWVEHVRERLDLDLDRRVRVLSRGNLQKLALLQAVMHRPDLLILDEPTTGLDPLVQRTVLALLAEMREAGSTIFFSSHNIAEVEKICHRVAFVRGGRLVGVESIRDLQSRRLARVEIHLAAGASETDWRAVEGVMSAECFGDRVVLTVRGGPQGLLRRLSSLPVENITWEPARLEDHFYAYYEGEAE